MPISSIRRVLLSTASAVAALALLLASPAAAAPVSTSAPASAPTQLDWVQSVLDAANVPGASVTLVTSASLGETVTTHGQSATEPVRVGSVSKGVAGAVADAMVQDGTVSLTEPVGTYLPTLPEPYRTFTLQQLLTHTTGLPHDVTVTDGDRPKASAQSLLSTLPVHPKLGSGYRYSSLNYIVVQAVIEARSGTTYAQALTRYLGADVLHADCATPVREGRVPFFVGDVPAPEVCDGSGFGYGYLSGTPTELARWAQWNLSAPGRAFHERSQQHSVPVREGQCYGFGWNYGSREVDGAQQTTISHPGAVPGTYTLVTLLPELDKAVVVSIPSYGELRAQESTNLADRAIAVALGDDPEPATKSTSSGALIIGVFTALAVAALAALAFQVKRIVRGRPRRPWRIAAAALVAVVAWLGAALGVPAATGVDIMTLATWAPDLALVIAVLVGAATGGLVLSVLQRGRPTQRAQQAPRFA